VDSASMAITEANLELQLLIHPQFVVRRDLAGTLRGEMAQLGTTLRGEMAELGSSLRGEMQELGQSLITRMMVLHEDVISRIALISEGRPRPSGRRKPRKK